MTDREDAEQERLRRLGERISQERVNQKLTLGDLAAKALLDEKTVRTAISGQRVRRHSLNSICKILNIDPDEKQDTIHVASEKFGSYNLDHYRDYIGYYFAYRRGFVDPENILRSVYRILWDDLGGERRLKFEEKHRYVKNGKVKDYSQDGDIYIDNSKNIVQLLTLNKGDLRLISLARMQDQQKSLSGIVATNAHLSFFYQPSASAIFFQRIEAALTAEEMESHVGPIYSGSKEFDIFNELLKDIEQNVGLFAISRQNTHNDEGLVHSKPNGEAHTKSH